MKDVHEEEIEGMTAHLDDDAFAELMMGGAASKEAQTHLETCAQCRAEVAKFHESVGGFGMASLAWSEEKSEEMPALRPGRAKVGGLRLVPAFGWAVAVLLALGVAVPVKRHLDAVHEAETASAAATEEDAGGLNSAEQIAKDNQLMADVNYELERSRATLRSQYDRGQGAATARKKSR